MDSVFRQCSHVTRQINIGMTWQRYMPVARHVSTGCLDHQVA